jgi:hypothetical protein
MLVPHRGRRRAVSVPQLRRRPRGDPRQRPARRRRGGRGSWRRMLPWPGGVRSAVSESMPTNFTLAHALNLNGPGRHARVSRGSDKPDVTSPADQRPRLANAMECATDTLRANLCIRASGRDRDSARAPRHDSAMPIGPNQCMVRPIQICRSRASAICTAGLAGSPSAVRAICVGYETPPARSPTGRGA